MANRKGKCRLVKLLIPLDACKHLCAHSTLEPFRTVRDFKNQGLANVSLLTAATPCSGHSQIPRRNLCGRLACFSHKVKIPTGQGT